MSQPTHLEESIITLPILENGVIALGDLWDCRSSTCPGSILNDSLTSEYVEAHPMKCLEYTLVTSKNTSEKLNNLHIDASLKLEMMEGKIVIKGSATFDRKDTHNFNEEALTCTYLLYSYKIRTRPNIKELVNKEILDKITSSPPTMSATHYVQEVLIGAHAVASIKYSKKIDNENFKIAGSLEGKLELGPITVDAKVSLTMLDKEESENYNTSISLKASPPLQSTPTKVKDMFREIEKLDETVKKEEHYKHLFKEAKIYGVPLTFKLVPLSQLFDAKLDNLYKLMEQEIMDEFLSMICTLQDFTGRDYVKTLMVEKSPGLVIILRDPDNPFTIRITELEIEFSVKAKLLKSEAFLLFGQFKEGEADVENLLKLIKKYDADFNIVKIIEQVQELVREGKVMLTAIHTGDTIRPVEGKLDEDGEDITTYVEMFTNLEDLEDWWSQERKIKILFQTNVDVDGKGGSASGTFIKLYDMTFKLSQIDIEVGVALPDISKNYSLTFKIGSKAVEYPREDINFALEVLGISIDKGQLMSTLFYTLSTASLGLYQPYDMADITSLVSVMKQLKQVTICESYVQFMATISDTRSGVWNFVLPLESTHAGIEMIRFFRQLGSDFPAQQPDVEHRWIVTRFNNTPVHDAPLLLVFRNGELQAVCLDHLDILILLNQFMKAKNSILALETRALMRKKSKSLQSAYPPPDLSVLSGTNMRQQCFYPERANFPLPILQNLVNHNHQTYLTEPVTHLPGFQPQNQQNLLEAIETTRLVSLRREIPVMSAIARHACVKYDKLEVEVLMPVKCGWKQSHQMFTSINQKYWEWVDLSKAIDGFIAKLAPYLGATKKAIEELNDLVKEVEFVDPEEDEKPDQDQDVEQEEFSGIERSLKRKQFERELDDGIVKTRVEAVIKFITSGSSDDFDKIKSVLDSYKECTGKAQLYGSLGSLQLFYAEGVGGEEFFYLILLQNLVDGLAGATNTIKPLYQLLATKYCARILPKPAEEQNVDPEDLNHGDGDDDEDQKDIITEEKYPGVARRIQDGLLDCNFFKVLNILVKCTAHPDMFKVQQELYNQSSVTNAEAMKNAIEKMNDWGFGEKNLHKEIWLNSKFLYWIREGADNMALLETIKVRLCYDDEKKPAIPRWIPHDIADKLQPLFYAMQLNNYEWNRSWTDLDSVVQVFQCIVTRRLLPVGFMAVFRDQMDGNEELYKIMLTDAKVLYFWNEDEFYFEEPWSVNTVIVALAELMKFQLQELAGTGDADEDGRKKRRDNLEDWMIEVPEEEGEAKPIVLNRLWRDLTLTPPDGKLPIITHKEWNTITAVQPRPFIQNESLLPNTIGQIIPYLLQTILKLQDCRDLADTSRVASFLNYGQWAEKPGGPRPGYIEFLDSDVEDDDKVKKFLLTRGDLITALSSNLTDPLLALHVCQTLLTGLGNRIALPLIVPNMSSESGGAKSLLPLLQQIYILTNSQRDGTSQGGWRPLLNNNSRLVATVRVGSCSFGIGKSTILNLHVVNNEQFFSSRLEAGCEHGPPVQRTGLVEFTQLSRHTVSDGFWDAFGVAMENPSDIYLANVHGDGLGLADSLTLLKHYASSFVIFWQAANWTELRAKKKEMNAILGKGDDVLNLIVDPDETILEHVRDHQNIIYTSKLQDPSTPAKLYNVFKEALKWPGKLADVRDSKLDFVSITTPDSSNLLSYIREHTLSTIRGLFQQVHNSLSKCRDEAECKAAVLEQILENPVLSRVLTLYIRILNLPLSSRFNAMTHLDAQLGQMSQALNQRYVERILKLERELFAYLKEARADADADTDLDLDVEYIRSIQNEIKGVAYSRESMSLDLAQFWKQLDFIIPLYVPQVRGQYHDTYTRLLKNGWAVQLQDGDDGAENSQLLRSYRDEPIKHIFQEFLPPDLRVFVISVLGLCSSGKSTLLNSVFGNSCGQFPVGLGGCTKGLVVRLHYLSPALSSKLKLDAILVLDSEGFGSAANYLDDAADIYERELATFLLGVSHLSLVHVVEGRGGRGFGELQQILEIAFLTLTTMDGTRPTSVLDILFVHEPVDDEAEQTIEPVFLDQFKSSVDGIVQFTQSREIELQLGVKTPANQVLDVVSARVKHQEILFNTKLFGADLFSKILEVCSQLTEERLGVAKWFEFKNQFLERIVQLGSNHPAITTTSTTSPLLFKSLQDLTNTSALLKRTRHVKQLVDLAYRSHAGSIEDSIDDRMTAIFDDNDELDEEYPPKDPQLKPCEDADQDLRQLMDEQGTLLWSTINTCDSGGRVTSKRRDASDSNSCPDCLEAYTERENLMIDIEASSGLRRKRQLDMLNHIENYQRTVRDSIWSRLTQKAFSKQLRFRCVLELRQPEPEEETPETQLNDKAKGQFVASKITVIPAWRLIQEEILQEYSAMPPAFINRVNTFKWSEDESLPNLEIIKAFDLGNYNKASGVDSSGLTSAKPYRLTWEQNDWIAAKMEDLPGILSTEANSKTYLVGMVRQLQSKMIEVLDNFEIYCEECLEYTFKWEAHLYALIYFNKFMRQTQLEWNQNSKSANHPLVVWAKLQEVQEIVVPQKVLPQKPAVVEQPTEVKKAVAGSGSTRIRRF